VKPRIAFAAFALMLSAVLLPTHAQAEPKVLFVSDRDEPGNYDLYVMDLDTYVVRRLTTDPGIDNHPDLSPDGTKVIWSSTRKREKPSDPTETNPEGDFEIFLADWSETDYLDEVSGTVHQLTSNDVTDLHLPPGLRNIPDRHPHFSSDGIRIIYTAKYVCVATLEVTWVSECSIPRPVYTVDPCGRNCEGLRIMNAQDLDGDHVGDDLINIDHAVLSAANPAVWPPRPADDARWIGHPSFSHDGTRILFSGAVDGEGRNWEVYVADWSGTSVTGLRQVTDGSLYPPNPNPIKMSGGAHFSHDDLTIYFTSTRTSLGNSQLFAVSAAADHVPVQDANRYPAASDLANDYVPEPLDDGRIVVTSDRDPYQGMRACGGGPAEYTAVLSPLSDHTIRVEASGTKAPASGGPAIHLDAYYLDLSLLQETDGTTYSAGWSAVTSPNASLGTYQLAPGTAGETVDLAIPPGTSTVKLLLGRTRDSGVARILVDGVPITDGDTVLPGDAGMSGWDLYDPLLSTSNDLDLVLIGAGGSSQTNLTDNDFADEMLLIGDEVSWFCGLSPNLSRCTYLPKSLRMDQLCAMWVSDSYLPATYPSRCLYPLAMLALNDYMSSVNPLRPWNHVYWQQVISRLCNPAFASELIVLPTPVNYTFSNAAPSPPAGPNPTNGAVITTTLPAAVPLAWAPSSDPDGDARTYDTYLGSLGKAMLLLSNDKLAPAASATNLAPGFYRWRVVAKDCRGGMRDGPTWSFEIRDILDVEASTLPGFRLSQNRPNPFAKGTTIDFVIPAGTAGGEATTLRVYDVSGQLVKELVQGALPAGRHTAFWDGRDQAGRPVAAGVFYYRIRHGGITDAKRMILTR